MKGLPNKKPEVFESVSVLALTVTLRTNKK